MAYYYYITIAAHHAKCACISQHVKAYELLQFVDCIINIPETDLLTQHFMLFVSMHYGVYCMQL